MAETESSTGSPERRRRAVNARSVAIVVAAGLLIWFALANLQDVRVHFWVSTTSAPVIVVIVIAGLCGAVIGHLVSRRRRRGGRAERRKEPTA